MSARGTFTEPRREVVTRPQSPLDDHGWAIYYKRKHLAVVGMSFRIAQQIAKEMSDATIITMAAAERVAHKHQLHATVCALCAGEDVRETLVI